MVPAENVSGTSHLGAAPSPGGTTAFPLGNMDVLGAYMADGSIDFEERLKQRIGRPARVESVAIRFTVEEAATLRQAAADRTTTVREWARTVLLREAQSRRTDAVFTETVAIRMLLNIVLKHVACGEVLTAEAFSEVLTKVRLTKRKQALEMMDQYKKES
jgi:hypothetical protein